MTEQGKAISSKLNKEPDFTCLIERIGQSDMLTTAYDTAWLARLSEIDRGLGFPALEWLCSNQLPDGSWGASKSYYYPDRVISTLSAMIALTYRGRRQSDKRQIEKGLEALEKMTDNATKGLATALKGPTVGFEMIVPTLVEQAEALGLIKQQKERILGRISNQRAKKLSMIKGKMINRHITVAFSAEMAGTDGQHLLDVENLQEKNGSVGCSPSATAYFALQVKREDQNAMEYLHRSRVDNGGVPNVAPFDIFEIAWTLWNLSIMPGYKNFNKQVKQHIDFLSQAWDTNRGAGFSSEYSVNDSDETAIVYDTLSRYGIEKNVDFILSFEEKEHFRCFDLENDPSISANVHILGALLQAGFKKENPSVKKILKFLQKNKQCDTYWDDKWHISPYYTTAHAIIVCAGFENELVAPAVEWIINSQKPDGSWGIFKSTPEETAYTIQALWLWNQNAKNIPREIFYRGKMWLEEHQHEYPPLWIGKCLYSPRLVIDLQFNVHYLWKYKT